MSETSITPPPARTDASPPPVIPVKPGTLRWLWLVGAAVGLSALAVLFFLNPSHHAVYPVCYFHRVTGYQCPGCGGLRAVHHLLRGEIGTAFRFNQMVVLGVPVLACLGVRRLIRGSQSSRLSLSEKAAWGWAILTVLVVFWIVRNLPIDIFRLPAE